MKDYVNGTIADVTYDSSVGKPVGEGMATVRAVYSNGYWVFGVGLYLSEGSPYIRKVVLYDVTKPPVEEPTNLFAIVRVDGDRHFTRFSAVAESGKESWRSVIGQFTFSWKELLDMTKTGDIEIIFPGVEAKR